MDEDDLMRRAIAAYYRFDGGETRPPDVKESGVEIIEGRRYVALRDINGLLKVYRVLPDGVLKVLKHGPAQLSVKKPLKSGIQTLLEIRFAFAPGGT